MKARTAVTPLPSDLSILNKDSSNVNNQFINKVYTKSPSDKSFTFENAEYVVVSTNNQIFPKSIPPTEEAQFANKYGTGSSPPQSDNIARHAKVAAESNQERDNEFNDTAGVCKWNYGRDEEHEVAKDDSTAKINAEKAVKEYLENLSLRAIQRFRSLSEKKEPRPVAAFAVPEEPLKQHNRSTLVHVSDLTISVNNPSKAILQGISKDLSKIRERVDQLQTSKATEAALAQFKQNYVFNKDLRAVI